MNLLVEYIQPLTNWLQENPHWSLFITFIISLAESLAIIGSIVPGSVTMTAIGILAGSGIMRVDFTLIAAILGAVAGDSLSYTLGYLYSERLVDMWPFKKYPHWLEYGKAFFAKHGGTSVLIGRFIGPLRSIIPVIAGILHMKQWHFFLANLISAIGWSLLYVMPGVLIGTASHELSSEDATHLFMLLFLMLAGIWLLSLLVKWLVKLLHSFLKRNLHHFWLELKKRPISAKLTQAITPDNERNHYTTALHLISLLLCFFFFIILLGLTIQGKWVNHINYPTRLFVQSIHTKVIEAFFIFCAQMTSTITTTALFIISCFWFIYHKNRTALIYLSGLISASYLVTFILNQCIITQRPGGILIPMQGSSFPDTHIMVATALYLFLLSYLNSHKKHRSSINTGRIIVFTLLGFSAFADLYLGDYWLTDIVSAFFLGSSLSLIFYFIYRKNQLPSLKISHPVLMMSSLLLALFISASSSTYINFNALSYDHTLYHKEFSLSQKVWWNQKNPILPLYRLNRIGKRISTLNIEYSGNLNVLREHLESRGWESQKESFFKNLLNLMNRPSKGLQYPLLTQLYENKAPSLFMNYTNKELKLHLELRMWESNYYLSDSNKPLWIGSIHPSTPINTKPKNNPAYFPELIDVLPFLFSDSKLFRVKNIDLTDSIIKKTTYPTQAKLLLIMQ